VAESTGLEPATSAVTGQRSNQLSYDSNPRNAKLEPNTMGFNQKNNPMGTDQNSTFTDAKDMPAGFRGLSPALGRPLPFRVADLCLLRCFSGRSAP
jgi:hypothetical protein